MTAVHGTVLVARPLWPVLGRVGDLLSHLGYSVATAGSWSALLAEPGSRAGLAGVLLGEYGSVAEEEEILAGKAKNCGPGWRAHDIEAFRSSSISGIVPIRSIGSYKFQTGNDTKTQIIRKLYADYVNQYFKDRGA